MWERFTERARKVMAMANEEAERFGHGFIGTEHILLGLLKERSGAGVDIDRMLLEVEQVMPVKKGPNMTAGDKQSQTAPALKVVTHAVEDARSLKHDHVGTEHILLGLLRESEGIASQVLGNLGVKYEDVRASL